jgi:hypothetical protein
VTRATLARLIAAIIVLTVVIAVPMVQIHWDGTQGSSQADKIDTLLNVMIVLSSFVFAIATASGGIGPSPATSPTASRSTGTRSSRSRGPRSRP